MKTNCVAITLAASAVVLALTTAVASASPAREPAQGATAASAPYAEPLPSLGGICQAVYLADSQARRLSRLGFIA